MQHPPPGTHFVAVKFPEANAGRTVSIDDKIACRLSCLRHERFPVALSRLVRLSWEPGQAACPFGAAFARVLLEAAAELCVSDSCPFEPDT